MQQLGQSSKWLVVDTEWGAGLSRLVRLLVIGVAWAATASRAANHVTTRSVFAAATRVPALAPPMYRFCNCSRF